MQMYDSWWWREHKISAAHLTSSADIAAVVTGTHMLGRSAAGARQYCRQTPTCGCSSMARLWMGSMQAAAQHLGEEATHQLFRVDQLGSQYIVPLAYQMVCHLCCLWMRYGGHQVGCLASGPA